MTLICIFDRDNPRILRQATEGDQPYKNWGNKTFSFAIPIPSHRQDTSEISIELYYTNEEITRTEANGRRLFLSNEFDSKSGQHQAEMLNCIQLSRIRRGAETGNVYIIDSEVFNRDSENIALPKNDFADYVLNQIDGFNDFDFSEFEAIFEIILEIASHS
jgi:RNA-directed DNA polymerase